MEYNLNMLPNFRHMQYNTVSCGMNEIDVGTPIQNFYAGQSLFITGGTGFLGKVLIEKLLRSCPDISKIYISIRPKKNKGIQERLEEMFSNRLFDVLKEKNPNFRDKIVPLECDMFAVGLGFSTDVINNLIKEVSVVFHLAATVNFTEKLKIAIAINIAGTDNIINFVKRMQNLKSFIYVSTLYANCVYHHVEERIYNYSISPKVLITQSRMLSDSELEAKVGSMLALWPNTYTFTKALAERLVAEECLNLPVGIFRPCVVSSTANEPLVGWIDNYLGSTAPTVLVMKGLMRVSRCDTNTDLSVVPVDICANALIAGAWDVWKQSDRRGDKILIYNQLPNNVAPLALCDYIEYLIKGCELYAVSECYAPPLLIPINNGILYKIYFWLFDLLPVFLIGVVKEKRLQNKLTPWYKNLRSRIDEINFFLCNSWCYSDENINAMWDRLNKEDKRLYNFNMKEFDWAQYISNYIKGLRIYLIKDDMSTLKVARNKWKRFNLLLQAAKLLIFFLFFWLIQEVFALIYL